MGLHSDHERQVAVIAPNGGKIWPVGSQQIITWNRTDYCGDVLKIELLRWMPVFSGSDIYRSCENDRGCGTQYRTNAPGSLSAAVLAGSI